MIYFPLSYICFFALLVVQVLSYMALIWNNCNSSILPAWTGQDLVSKSNESFSPLPWILEPQDQMYIDFPSNWSGRIWARQNCTADNVCLVGDCNGQLDCNGISSTNTTLIEFTIVDDRIYYDLSIGISYSKFSFLSNRILCSWRIYDGRKYQNRRSSGLCFPRMFGSTLAREDFRQCHLMPLWEFMVFRWYVSSPQWNPSIRPDCWM